MLKMDILPQMRGGGAVVGIAFMHSGSTCLPVALQREAGSWSGSVRWRSEIAEP